MKTKQGTRQRKSKKAPAVKDLKPKRGADVKGGAKMMTKSATMSHLSQ